MEKFSINTKISLEEFLDILKNKFKIADFSIIEVESDNSFSQEDENSIVLLKKDNKNVCLVSGKHLDRKDLLIIKTLVNLFKIHMESGENDSDSFSASVIKKISVFENFLDNFPGIIGIMDFQGKYVYVNKYAEENLNGKSWLEKKTSELFTLEQKQKLQEKNEIIKNKGYYKENDFFVDKKGRLRNFEKHSFLVEGKSESLIVILGIDITEKAVLETKLNDLAYKDSLTGINNYNYFLLKIEELLQNNERFSLIYIDIKKFRVINEIYGYEVGDKVLIHIVNLINRFVLKLREINNTILTRFKDDEFILIYKKTNKKDAVNFARELISFLKQPVIINDIVYRLDLDVGISSFPDDGVVKETLLRKAALAKNKARLNNEVHLVSFSEDLEAEIKREYELESEIHDSLEKGEFELYLQPILDLESERIVKAEALIRWNHKKYGIVYPNDFIPVAEKSNLILKIGEWVLEEACKILKRWESKKINIPISVNISGKQLLQYNLPSVVENIFIKYDLEPEKIIMEVTENYIFEEAEHLKEIISKLNSIGIRFSIDDFGTGNSSMTKLKHINFAEIKIDRSFISGLLVNKTDEHLVKSIITLAKDLELDVVAEGIEDLKQFAFLNKLGCKYLQGFLFSKPVRVKKFEKLLEKKFDFKKKAIKELKDTFEEKFICGPQKDCEKIYCNMPLPVVIIDSNFKIAGFNNKFQEIFKWTEFEIYGKALSRISNGNTLRFLKTALQRESQDFQEIKIPLMRRDGVLLDAVVSIDRSDFSSEKPSYFVCIITKINTRDTAQEHGYQEYLDKDRKSVV